MADVDNLGARPAASGEEVGDEFDGFLRGGEADARKFFAGEMVEALEGESEVSAAFVVGDSVDFVDDYGFDGFENFTAACGGQQNVEGFRSGDEDVRRVREHGAAFVGEGVTGADSRANFGHEVAALAG